MITTISLTHLWVPPILCQDLASHNNQPVGISGYQGLQAGVDGYPIPVIFPFAEENQGLVTEEVQKLLDSSSNKASSRVSELQALDLLFRIYQSEGVVFTMPTLGKKRTAEAPLRR